MSSSRAPVCITISAVDTSGTQYAQADLKTFTALGTYGAIVPTAILHDNLTSHRESMALPAGTLRQALNDLRDQLTIDAVKIGVIANAEQARVIGRWLRDQPGLPVVVDPVLTDNVGIPQQQPEVIAALSSEILPRAAILTPNRFEAALLADMEEVLGRDDMEEAARRLFTRFGCPVVVTGGGIGADSLDVSCAIDGISHFTLAAVPHSDW
ncbi:MAG: bifunctional hydroxymethylpyrimidine kinase/phosphomethylpyrimidine kinase, partial [Planctomycetota bacterium]